MSSDKFAARVEDDTRFALLAEKIVQWAVDGDTKSKLEYKSVIAEALRAVASEERAEVDRLTKEAFKRGVASQYGPSVIEAIDKARTAALEEAAKVAERTDIGVHVDCRRRVSAEIRKLKGEK